MILVGRKSSWGVQESRSARWRKPRGTRASTSNFRAVPGRTATTDQTFKAAVTGGCSVNPRSSSSFSPTTYFEVYGHTTKEFKKELKERYNTDLGCCHHRVHGRGAVGQFRIRAAGQVGWGWGRLSRRGMMRATTWKSGTPTRSCLSPTVGSCRRTGGGRPSRNSIRTSCAIDACL